MKSFLLGDFNCNFGWLIVGVMSLFVLLYSNLFFEDFLHVGCFECWVKREEVLIGFGRIGYFSRMEIMYVGKP
jgi:hypothetical protein